MNGSASVTGRFISAVRRRMAVVCIAESVAMAVAIAAAVGLMMIPILWWRGESGVVPAVAILALGLCCGLIHGVTRIPTRMQAAVEADRQLELHDLLSTVYSLTNLAGTWESSIAAISNQRCRQLRPSAVVVAHFGLRAWGGVGILGALLLALSVLTSRPVSAGAADSSWKTNSMPVPQAIETSQVGPAGSSEIDRPPGPGGTDEISNREFEQDRPDDTQAAASSNSESNHSASAGDSAGGGIAVTHGIVSVLPPPLADAKNIDTRRGQPADGAGQSDAQARVPGDSNSASASPANSAAHAPPWQTSQWPGDIAAARTAIESGRVSDSDADLVRDYFQRD